MLQLAIALLVIALLAALLGFGGLAGSFVGLAKIVFIVFLILAVLSFFGGHLLRETSLGAVMRYVSGVGSRVSGGKEHENVYDSNCDSDAAGCRGYHAQLGLQQTLGLWPEQRTGVVVLILVVLLLLGRL